MCLICGLNLLFQAWWGDLGRKGRLYGGVRYRGLSMIRSDVFPIHSVEAEWVMGDEPMGSKNKFWIEQPGDDQPWLFKYTRTNNGVPTGEHWAEKVAADIAGQLHIPHARVELAELEGCFGSLSRRMEALGDDGVELVHGNDLLAGLLHNYDREQVRGQQQHTLGNVLAAIGKAMGHNEGVRNRAFVTLGGYVVLDALILNTDRHHENWALLRRTSPGIPVFHRLAPTFDHASSLGRELTEARLEQWLRESWRAEWYAKRGTGGIFLRPEGRRGMNPIRLAEAAHRHWPQYVAPWLQELRAIGLESLLSPFDRVPVECMGSNARAFARQLLTYTYERLTALS